jgi:CheY-like chemotaxis protein
LDLINEILDFSRLEAGRIVLDDAPFELGGVIQEIVELLSPKAHDKGLELVMRIAPGTPTALSGDAGRLRQVLFNLVGNAVKFTEAGGVAVFAQSGGPGRIVISVRDTGLGIAEDKQALIFEEFAQADVAHARMHGGTGLGLAIVRKLAATMGGTVSLASAPGAGATFSIDLPFAARAAPIAPTPLVGLRIALISANRVLLSEAAALLRDLGAQVQAATTLGRTIDADVILLDHAAGGEPPARLPQSAPVIVLAPQEERAAIAGYQTRGAQHYLLKPLRVRSLVEQIRSAVDRRPATMQSLRDEREMDPGADGALAGLKVLVADDNPINALLARTLLARAGCMVQVVCDGEEAVQAALAAEAPFDLILLDLRMPGVDGFAAARLIRASGGPAAATPLIALTADSAEEDRKAALAAGMDEFLTKPIDLARLMHAVAQFTRRPEAASAVR